MGKKNKKKITWDDLENQTGSNRSFGKGKTPMLKLKPGKNKVLILPPYKGTKFIKDVLVHTVWKNGKVKAKAASPLINDGDTDKVFEYGKKLRDRFSESKSKRLKDLCKMFYPNFNETYANVLDMNDLEKGVQVLKLPKPAVDAIHESKDDFDSTNEVFDLDEGHVMLIKAKGEGRNRSYTARFLEKNSVNLLEDGKVDENVLKGLIDLDYLQPKVKEKDLDKVFRLLKETANKIIEQEKKEASKFPEDEDDDEDDDVVDSDDDEDENDDDSDDDDSDDDDSDDDDDNSDDDEDEDDEEDEEDGDDDEDDMDLDDDDDEEEVEVKKKPAKKKKPVKKKVAKKSKSKKRKRK